MKMNWHRTEAAQGVTGSVCQCGNYNSRNTHNGWEGVERRCSTEMTEAYASEHNMSDHDG